MRFEIFAPNARRPRTRSSASTPSNPPYTGLEPTTFALAFGDVTAALAAAALRRTTAGGGLYGRHSCLDVDAPPFVTYAGDELEADEEFPSCRAVWTRSTRLEYASAAVGSLARISVTSPRMTSTCCRALPPRRQSSEGAADGSADGSPVSSWERSEVERSDETARCVGVGGGDVGDAADDVDAVFDS